MGRCTDCQQWNTFMETPVTLSKNPVCLSVEKEISELSRISAEEMPRIVLPIAEFNRVLGGGIIPGSLVLISGDPGIGKSTLLLQVSGAASQRGDKVVYASGEESSHQIKLRADRLGVKGERLYLLPETDLDMILQKMESVSPRLGVIDSIQTVYLRGLDGVPGSISQIRECTQRLMYWAKLSGVSMLISGHVTKEGAIAGPRVLEHIVDAVIYLEGEAHSTYRLLRGVKNRFGSTNEVGIFEMKEQGLVEVANPAQIFLSQHQQGAIGATVTPTLEGTRPLLVEIQALTTNTSFGLPRRTANGVDFNRLLLITAVLTKRARMSLGNQDIIVNAVGGLKVSEPAADLAIALTIASTFSDREIDNDLVVMGEIGLSGEIRGVPQVERRLAEAARQGFTRCLMPGESLKTITIPKGMVPLAVNSIKEALHLGLKAKTNN